VAIVVNCPACGTPASIEETFFGKKLRCANQSCRQLFRVSSEGSVQLEGAHKTGRSRGADEADWLSAPPPRAGEIAHPAAAWTPAAPAPAASDEDSEPRMEHRTGEYTYKRKKHPVLLVFIAILGLLVVGSAGLFWWFKNNQARAVEALKKDYLDAKSKKRWDEVLTKAQAYREKTGDAADLKDVDFDIAWAKLQQALNPGQLRDTAGVKKGIDELVQFEKTKKSEKPFSEMRDDLFLSAATLVKAGSEQLDKQPDAATVAALQPVVKIMDVYQKDAINQDQAATLTKEAKEKYDSASEAVAAETGKKQWLARDEDVLKKQNISMIDDLQQSFQEMAKAHPRLATDADLQEKLNQLTQVEPRWVVFTKKDDTPPTMQFPFGTSLRICPPVKTPDGVKDDSGTVLAMARGTLYGLSAKTGKDRWALRVGQDLNDLPPRITQGADQPDLAFVVTTEQTKDEGFHTWLSCMNLQSGERLWARRLSGVCSAGPILIGTRLAVPMKDGLSIVEAATGKMTGFFNFVGYDLSVPPVFDRLRNRLFVPVDRRRLFVVELSQNACIGVIYTNHQAGGLKGAPLIVDDVLVTCVISGSGVGKTNVQAYDLKSPKFEMIANYEIPGHATSTPYVDGSTVGVVTDSGMIAFYGVGKGAPPGSKGNTPFFELAKPLPVRLQTSGEKKVEPPMGRSQIAFVSLGDWWVFSQDELYRSTFDPYRGQLLPSTLGSVPLGTPLHRSELTPDGKLLVTITKPKNQEQRLATGIDCTTGQIVWQTQLGTVASQEPISLGDSVAMLDRGGAVFLVSAQEISPAAVWQVCGVWPALPVFAASHKLVRTPNGNHLVSISFDPKRARLIERFIDLNAKSSKIKEFPLNYAPAGTPAAMDDGTVLVPCRDGNVYQFSFSSGTTASLFSWRDANSLPNVLGHLLLPTPNQLLASNGTNKVLRWDRTPQGSWRKAMTDLELPARAQSPLCLLPGSIVAVCDEAQTLHCLSLGTLASPKQWNVGGAITRGPFRVGSSGVGCIVDGKKAWWVNKLDEEKGRLFSAEAIVGEGTTVGNELVLAVLKRDAELGVLAGYAWVDLETGKAQHLESLTLGLAPASGPVALGKDRVFAPLSDGTVRILSKSEPATAAVPK
jgi:outer membrane protein assembly factor BamB